MNCRIVNIWIIHRNFGQMLANFTDLVWKGRNDGCPKMGKVYINIFKVKKHFYWFCIYDKINTEINSKEGNNHEKNRNMFIVGVYVCKRG